MISFFLFCLGFGVFVSSCFLSQKKVSLREREGGGHGRGTGSELCCWVWGPRFFRSTSGCGFTPIVFGFGGNIGREEVVLWVLDGSRSSEESLFFMFLFVDFR